MLVLHTHWEPPLSAAAEGRLIFWMEQKQPAKKRIDRRQKHVRPHPFTTVALDVKQILGRLCPGQVIALRAEKMVLWLPTGKLGPQPSPPLQSDWGMPGDRLQLLPWRIEGLRVTLAQAFTLLQRLPYPDFNPSQLRCGDDTLFWRTAVALILETLALQKLFPGLIRTPIQERLIARWLPLLDHAADGARLARLSAAMPPLCCAAGKTVATAPSPQALLQSFLHSTLDAVVRSWMRREARSSMKLADDPGEKWLLALQTINPTLSLNDVDHDQLWSAYQLWQRSLTVAGDASYRVALRLDPPEMSSEKAEVRDWTLSFWLQARDDPSLLVPAAEVWRAGGGLLTYLDRKITRADEILLSAIGYITRFFSPLKRALQSDTPTHLDCTATEAYAFLRHCAPILEQSGFGLFVPSWWDQRQARLGAQLHMAGRRDDAPPTGQGFMSLEKVVEFEWRLSLGNTLLTHEEFNTLVALKTPLVQIRGRWVRLDPDQIEAAIRFWQRRQQPPQTASLPQTLQMVLQPQSDIGGLPLDGVESTGWLKQWLTGLQSAEKLQQLPPPQGLQAKLRPYQRYGFSWLYFMRRWGMGAILADDMGLGKTLMALTMLLQVKNEEGALPGPVLLVCPTSVVTNWHKECQRFTPGLRAIVHQGPDRRRDKDLLQAIATHDLLLTSYALIRRDEARLRPVKWHGIILDEAQNIKNPHTQQARILRSLQSDFRCALTGTPIENRLSELWSIMQFLNPGFLGSQKHFQQVFALPIERYRDPAAVARLRNLNGPFILRRVKEDPTVITDLPEKQEMKVYCNLTTEQATLYAAVVQETLAAIDGAGGINRKGLVLAMLTKLKQICNHPAQFLHQTADGRDLTALATRSGKLARLAELLEEIIAEKDRALIFTQFTGMGVLLHRFLLDELGIATLYLHGSVPANHREELVNRFQDDKNGPPLFLLSLKAGGIGLNLTKANHVFHFDRWWNPAVEDQATDRAFRIGQRRNVFVHKFVCLGTLEEKIDEMLTEKKELAHQIVGGGENWVTELSTAELRELVTLRQEAFA